MSNFARFNSLYSHHPVHPRFQIEDFCEAPRTGKPFLVKPIHGKISRQSLWGITVPIIGAVTPMHPAQAIGGQLWLRPLVTNRLTVSRPRKTYPMP